MGSIRVLIADDSTLLRQLLAEHLERQPGIEVIGQARDGHEAVALAARLRPDVVVMDLAMPELNGIHAMERIKAHRPQLPVVILTAHEELASVGLSLNAAECLHKSCSTRDLAEAIRRAHTAAAAPAPAAAPAADHAGAVERLAVQSGLTPHEKAVLRQLAVSEMTNGEIAAALTAQSGERVTPSSVKHALERIFEKTRVEPRTRGALLRRVRDLGQRKGYGG